MDVMETLYEAGALHYTDDAQAQALRSHGHGSGVHGFQMVSKQRERHCLLFFVFTYTPTTVLDESRKTLSV